MDDGTLQGTGVTTAGTYGISVSPDGRSIAFTAGTATVETWLLEDFLPVASSKQ